MALQFLHTVINIYILFIKVDLIGAGLFDPFIATQSFMLTKQASGKDMQRYRELAYNAYKDCVTFLEKSRHQIRAVFNRNFLECLQLDTSSFLLFRLDISGLQIMKNFSYNRYRRPISHCVTRQ